MRWWSLETGARVQAEHKVVNITISDCVLNRCELNFGDEGVCRINCVNGYR